MVSRNSLAIEIEHLKREMEMKAMELTFNFQHPEVLHLSKQLDVLIVKKMKLDQLHLSSK